MATIEKRARSYRVVFRVDGRKYSRSLKTKNEKEARGFLARLEDSLRRIELGTLALPGQADLITYLLSDGHLHQKPKGLSNLSLKNLFDKYLASIPDGSLEQSTIMSIEVDQRHLMKHLGARFPVRTLTLPDLQEYVQRRSNDKGRRGKKVCPYTVKRTILSFQTVWNWGMRQGLLNQPFPNKGLRYAKLKDKASFRTFSEVDGLATSMAESDAADLWDCVFLTVQEIEELLNYVKAAASQAYIYPMFVFAAHTGARRSEFIRSTLSDLDFAGSTVVIQERKRIRGKLTNRRVPIPSRLFCKSG